MKNFFLLASFVQKVSAGATTFPQKLAWFGGCVALSLLIAWLLLDLLIRFVRRRYPQLMAGWGDRGSAARYPLFWCLSLTGIFNSLSIFQLPAETVTKIFRWYSVSIVFLLWLAALNLVRCLGGVCRDEARRSGSVYHKLLIDLLQPLVKALLWIAGILFLLDNVFHFKIGALLAGAGVASMAVAFAAQNTIANLFGAIALIIDRPFLVGDRILVNNQEGTVELIGLRSVRLLALDGTVWYIPNRILAESTIINLSRRSYSRCAITLSLTYSHTPEKLQEGKTLLQEILEQNPLVDHDSKPVVTFDNLGAYSLDLQVTCRLKTADKTLFRNAKDELNMQILKVFTERGFDFAFPTQSLCIEKIPAVRADAVVPQN